MMKILRPILLLSAFAVGIAVPQAHIFSPLIPWFIRFMLLILFLQIDFHEFRLRRSHFFILALNLLIGVGAWKILTALGYPTLGLAAFFVGITPTGTAAPVVTGFLGRKVEYVVTSFILNTLGVAASLIFLMPMVLGEATPTVFFDVAEKIGGVVFLPFLLAMILRRFCPVSRAWPKRLKMAVFIAWVLVLTIIISGASYYIRTTPNVSWMKLFEIAGISLALCVLNFVAGYWVGEPENRREASQSLGQKNTSITIWLAAAYANPLVALGPTLYVLWHNSWNAIQLEEYARRNDESKKDDQIAVPDGLKK